MPDRVQSKVQWLQINFHGMQTKSLDDHLIVSIEVEVSNQSTAATCLTVSPQVAQS